MSWIPLTEGLAGAWSTYLAKRTAIGGLLTEHQAALQLQHWFLRPFVAMYFRCVHALHYVHLCFLWIGFATIWCVRFCLVLGAAAVGFSVLLAAFVDPTELSDPPLGTSSVQGTYSPESDGDSEDEDFPPETPDLIVYEPTDSGTHHQPKEGSVYNSYASKSGANFTFSEPLPATKQPNRVFKPIVDPQQVYNAGHDLYLRQTKQYVNGYERSGHYVEGYYRSKPGGDPKGDEFGAVVAGVAVAAGVVVLEFVAREGIQWWEDRNSGEQAELTSD